MRTRILIPAIALIGTSAALAQPGGRSAPPPPCVAGEGFVCGQQGPEDLVGLGPDWAVASAYEGTGGVLLVRVRDRGSFTVYPSDSAVERLDAETYPECPGPPRGRFTTHGVYVEPGGGPVHKLFVVGHGDRESIEVFEVDTRAATPAVTWTGCVIAPDPIGLNSVRGLPDGGFLTTNFLPRGQPMGQLMNGDPNGELWEWHTATGWVELPGSEASGANGVELSDDGETVYVAAWGSQSFIRLSRGAEPPVREEIDLGFRIDNIHFARDGRLLGAGQAGEAWRVVKIDPDSLEVELVVEMPNQPGFANGTVALEVGDDLWIGTFRGDRIAIVPAP